MVFTGAVACTGEKSASGQKVAAPEVQWGKRAVTDGKHREKRCTLADFTTEKVVVENNALGCAGSSNPYCVGKNDLLTTGGGGPGPVAGGVGAAGALATDGDKDGAGSKTETLPVNDDLTGGKLENPSHQGERDTSLITPDQRDHSGASHTGNSDSAPDTGGNTTVTLIPDGPNKDDIAYLALKGKEAQKAAGDLGFDRRIPPQKAPFDSHGQPVFYNGKNYITPRY